MIGAVAYVDEMAEEFIDEFLPGPVTVILPARRIISTRLTAGTGKIGIRYPDHDIALELISRYDTPITATSANLSGGPDPVSIDHAMCLMIMQNADLSAGLLQRS